MLIDALPYLARRVLRLTAERGLICAIKLRKAAELDIDQMRETAGTLVQHRLIERVQRSYRITQAGICCVDGVPSSTPSPATPDANTIDRLGRKALPSTTTRWGATRATPLCNSTTSRDYMGAELRKTPTRPGAQDFLRIPSLHNNRS